MRHVADFPIGACPAPEHWSERVLQIESSRLHPERFISRIIPLSGGAKACELFDACSDDVLKMELTA